MSTLARFLGLLLLLAVAGGVTLVAVWDMPPPAKHVEKPVPDERLPR